MQPAGKHATRRSDCSRFENRDSLAFMPCSGLVATRAPMVDLAFNWLQLLEHVAKTSNVEPLDAPMMNWFFSMLLQR